MSESKSVYKKLLSVQQKLRVPKDRRNMNGNYAFRNAADILERAKPFLEDVGAIVILNDEMITLGGETRYTNTDSKSPYSGKEILSTARFYVRATARFVDTESGEDVSVSANAREDVVRKGMDLAQLTGACSSYARKYALCGLFAIDDSKDDPDETNDEPRKTNENAPTRAPSVIPTTHTPAPVRSAENAKSAPSAKKESAWIKFKKLELTKSMDARSMGKFFLAHITKVTGKGDPKVYTDADWDTVIESIAPLAEGKAE